MKQERANMTNILKKIIYYIKNKVTKIYEITIKNAIFVCLVCILLFGLTKFLKWIFSEKLDLHIGLNVKINFLSIYCGFLSIILPVAILIIERVGKKSDSIISKTYLKYTKIFPIIVYFVFNLCIFTFFKDQYYFFLTSLVSTYFIIRMYYTSFKIISDKIYEKIRINVVREEIIADDLNDQIKHFSDDNLISNYKKYGIIVGKYDYISTTNYEKINIFPEKEYTLIEQYNYKVLDSIAKKLKEINKEYIRSIESDNLDKKINNEKKPNIIITLMSIGSTTYKNKSWITVYYLKRYEGQSKEIQNLLDNKAYIISKNNNHLYIETEYKFIQEECIKAINQKSSTLLTESLSKYIDIYKNYVNEIAKNIGQYTYLSSYNQVNSFYKIEAYDFLDNIQKRIYDYADIIKSLKNSKLMNSLISFLYEMILYSHKKRELLSIQHLYHIYIYLNECALELEDNIAYKKIELEIFELMNILKYDYNNIDKDYIHDVLLIVNRTLGNIIFELSCKDKEKCYKYYHKVFKFIDGIKEEIDSAKYTRDKNSLNYDKMNDVYSNYICNMFAITSYIVHNFKSENIDTSEIMIDFSQIDCNDLTKILVDAIFLDYNSRIYSWDLMDINRIESDNYDNCYTVHTIDYMISLYCVLITKVSKKDIKIDSNYELSVYADRIIKELKSMNKDDYVEIYEKVIDDVKKEEKEIIRNTAISDKRVDQFENKFIEIYNNQNKLYNLFKETNNFDEVNKKEKGKNYLGIRNIVEKTYFLDKMPNDRCIIWTNFEDAYVNSFINSEENRIAKKICQKATYQNNDIINYLEKLSKSKLKKSIIFSSYDAIHNIIESENIKYNRKENKTTYYSNMFIKIKNENIPVVVIDGLDKKYIIHVFNDELGKLEKLKTEFTIEISDFYNNEELIKKYMNEKINGLDLEGEEKKKHLLESVELFIEEYIRYDDTKLISKKFDH